MAGTFRVRFRSGAHEEGSTPELEYDAYPPYVLPSKQDGVAALVPVSGGQEAVGRRSSRLAGTQAESSSVRVEGESGGEF